MIIIILQKKSNPKIPKKVLKLKDFSIGYGDSKAYFKNIKRTKSKLRIVYSVDVYGKKGLQHKKLLVVMDNKRGLRKFLGKIYPLKMRKNM